MHWFGCFFQGERLGWQPMDFNIAIGKGRCEIVSVAADQVICRPPSAQPETSPLHPLREGYPHVQASTTL